MPGGDTRSPGTGEHFSFTFPNQHLHVIGEPHLEAQQDPKVLIKVLFRKGKKIENLGNPKREWTGSPGPALLTGAILGSYIITVLLAP